MYVVNIFLYHILPITSNLPSNVNGFRPPFIAMHDIRLQETIEPKQCRSLLSAHACLTICFETIPLSTASRCAYLVDLTRCGRLYLHTYLGYACVYCMWHLYVWLYITLDSKIVIFYVNLGLTDR